MTQWFTPSLIRYLRDIMWAVSLSCSTTGELVRILSPLVPTALILFPEGVRRTCIVANGALPTQRREKHGHMIGKISVFQNGIPRARLWTQDTQSTHFDKSEAQNFWQIRSTELQIWSQLASQNCPSWTHLALNQQLVSLSCEESHKKHKKHIRQARWLQHSW